ncbi:TROVE domain-containing protein [Nocardia vinacea]|uniref:TROVE domain-containing protein n=1 Tax=Nocardia vinacea TaxID=96468 RepID=UPI00340DCC8A
MSRFNTTLARPVGVSPIQTTGRRSTNALGAKGFERDKRSELFLLAVSNFVAQSTFHESAPDRDDRYHKLIRELAVSDGEWLAEMLVWLRGPEANMRSASLVGAAEYVHARLAAGIHGGNRHVISGVCQRADEPGEMLAYWTSRYGRSLPQPVKRGIADAAVRLYNQRSMLKYDTGSHGFRFADVLELTHPSARTAEQSWLFEHAIDRRHNRDNSVPRSLMMIRANASLRAMGPKQAEAYLIGTNGVTASAGDVLKAAGMTWEDMPSLLPGAWTAKKWEAIIPAMGTMALIRNLRNFDEAGVSDEVAAQVVSRFADPEEVRKSRMFPFRYYSAFKATGSLRWAHGLEQAVKHSLANVPELSGHTLILIDQSPSMFPTYYGYNYGSTVKSDISFAEKAALFGSALALRAENADLYGYGFKSYPVGFRKGDSVLKTMQKFRQDDGTDTLGALQQRYAGHDRVIIVTDEQTANINAHHRSWYNLPDLRPVASMVPAHVPVYTWNIAGYKVAHGTGPNWHTFGGMTDAAFKLIPLLERGGRGNWPWQS